MRLKKLLCVVTAVVVAMSAVVVTPTNLKTVEAAEKTEVLWSGTQALAWGNIDISSSDFLGYSTASLDITYTLTNSSATGTIQALCGGWTDDYKQSVDVSEDGTYTFTISTEALESISSVGHFYLVANNVTVTKISITGEYDESLVPTTDIWITDNENGTYSYTNTVDNGYGGNGSSALGISISSITNIDPALITSISFTTNLGTSGTIGINDASGNWKEGSLGEAGTQTLSLNGVKSGDSLWITSYWINVGETLVISDVTVTTIQPDTLYQQATDVVDGVYAKRFVQLISEDDASAASKVTFTMNDGTKDIVKESTKCYRTVSAAGGKLTAPDGYVFVAYGLKNIPEDVEITATCKID